MTTFVQLQNDCAAYWGPDIFTLRLDDLHDMATNMQGNNEKLLAAQKSILATGAAAFVDYMPILIENAHILLSMGTAVGVTFGEDMALHNDEDKRALAASSMHHAREMQKAPSPEAMADHIVALMWRYEREFELHGENLIEQLGTRFKPQATRADPKPAAVAATARP